MEASSDSALRKHVKQFMDRCVDASNNYCSDAPVPVNPTDVLQKNITIAVDLFDALNDFALHLLREHQCRLTTVPYSILSLVKHYIAIFKFEAERMKLAVMPEVVTFEQMINRLLIPLSDQHLTKKVFEGIPAESELLFVCTQLLRDFYDHYKHVTNTVSVWCIPDPEVEVTLRGMKCLDLRGASPTADAKSCRYPPDTNHDYMLDIGSLQTMISSVDVAIKSVEDLAHAVKYTLADVSTVNRTVQRALQILGEYMKSTDTTCHLSKDTQTRLRANKIPIDALSPIRNAFSHTHLQLLMTQRKGLDHHRGLLLTHFNELEEMRAIVMEQIVYLSDRHVNNIIATFGSKHPTVMDICSEQIQDIVSSGSSKNPDVVNVALRRLTTANEDRSTCREFESLLHRILLKRVMIELVNVWETNRKQDHFLFNMYVRKITKKLQLAVSDVKRDPRWQQDYDKKASSTDITDFARIKELKLKIGGAQNSTSHTVDSELQKDYNSDLINFTFWKCFFDEFDSELSFVAFLKENNIGGSLNFDRSILRDKCHNHNAVDYLEILSIIRFHKIHYEANNYLYAMLSAYKKFEPDVAIELIDKLVISPAQKKKLLKYILSEEDKDWSAAKKMLMMEVDSKKINFYVESFFHRLYFEKENSNIDYSLLHTVFEKLDLADDQCEIMKEMIAKLIQFFNLAQDSSSIFDDIIKETLDHVIPDLPTSIDSDVILSQFDIAKMLNEQKRNLLTYISGDANNLDRQEILRLVKKVITDEAVVKKCERFSVKQIKKLKNYLIRDCLKNNLYDELLNALYEKQKLDKLLGHLKNVCHKMFKLDELCTETIIRKFTEIARRRYKANFMESKFELESTLKFISKVDKTSNKVKFEYFRNSDCNGNVEIIAALQIIVLNMLNDLKDFPGKYKNYSQMEYLLVLGMERCANQKFDINHFKLRNCLAHGNPLAEIFNINMTTMTLQASYVLANYGHMLWELRENLQDYQSDNLKTFIKSGEIWNSESTVNKFVDYLNQKDSENSIEQECLSERALATMIDQDTEIATIENNFIKYLACQKVFEIMQNETQRCERKLTCLFLASCFSSFEIVSNILEGQINVDDWTSFGFTALNGSSANNNCDIITLLLNKGSNVNCASTSKHLSSLHLSVFFGQHRAIYTLLSNNANVDGTTADMQTPLHLAVARGDLKSVGQLLQRSANVDVIDLEGISPMHLAVCKNQTDVLKVVLAQSHNVDISAESHFTPLYYAVACNALEAVTALRQSGADASRITSQGLNVLHIASMIHSKDEAHNVCQDIFRQIFVSKEQLFVADKKRKLPLHCAVIEENENALEILLEMDRSTRHIDAGDCYNLTPLSWAVAKKNEKVVELLLKAGANPNCRDLDGGTPLHIAALKANWTIAKLLLQAGALMHIENNYGNKPLHWTTKCVDIDEADITRLISTFQQFGGNINCQEDESGMTPLCLSAKQDTMTAVNSLLSLGADTEVVDQFQYTPLLYAVFNNNRTLFTALLTHGANIYASDDLGMTPLHVACFKGCPIIAQQLLGLGVDPNIRTNLICQSLTPLHLGAQHNNLNIVRLLLEQGANINDQADNGHNAMSMAIVATNVEIIHHLLKSELLDIDYRWQNHLSYLHFAVNINNKEIVSALVKRGVPVDSKDARGFTPLMRACEKGFLDVVKQLLDLGADINAHSSDGPKARSSDGSNALIEASNQGYKDTINWLLDRGAIFDSSDEHLLTPLASACCHGHLEVIKFLLEHKANIDIVARKKEQYFSCLDLAVLCGHPPVVAFLIDAGFTSAMCDDTHRMTLLHSASFGGGLALLEEDRASNEALDRQLIHFPTEEDFFEIVTLLLNKGADILSTNENQEIPLHLASNQGLDKIVTLLLTKGSPIDAPDKFGNTPLMKAASTGRMNTVKLLIDRGASVNAQSYDGKNALHFVASSGNAKMTDLLLDSGAKINELSGNGVSPLVYACLKGDHDTAKILLDRGADMEAVTAGEGISPLAAAIEVGHSHIVQLLLDRGASIYATDHNGQQILHHAAGKSNKSIMTTLIFINYFGKLTTHCLVSSESNFFSHVREFVNVRDRIGHTPLHHAATTGKLDSALVLLQNGAIVDAEDEDWTTPMQLAASQGHVDVCKILLLHGAIINKKDVHGISPIHIACSRGHMETVKFLIQEGANIYTYIDSHPFWDVNRFDMVRLEWLRRAIQPF